MSDIVIGPRSDAARLVLLLTLLVLAVPAAQDDEPILAPADALMPRSFGNPVRAGVASSFGNLDGTPTPGATLRDRRTRSDSVPPVPPVVSAGFVRHFSLAQTDTAPEGPPDTS